MRYDRGKYSACRRPVHREAIFNGRRKEPLSWLNGSFPPKILSDDAAGASIIIDAVNASERGKNVSEKDEYFVRKERDTAAGNRRGIISNGKKES